MKQQLCALALFLCCLPAEGAVNMFFPIVTRARGVSTTFYTAIDITNNHSSASTDVLFQYRSADGAINTGQSGDVLVFRARIQQGVPCIAEYTGAGTDSYIVISP
jgi:hypothetical protein